MLSGSDVPLNCEFANKNELALTRAATDNHSYTKAKLCYSTLDT